MSIHEQIKTRRLAASMSMTDLAKKVSEIEGLAKPLQWQTVQQWEKNTAPKRKRLESVAKALGCDVMDLMGGAPAAANDRAMVLGAAETLRTCLTGLMSQLSELDKDTRDGVRQSRIDKQTLMLKASSPN